MRTFIACCPGILSLILLAGCAESPPAAEPTPPSAAGKPALRMSTAGVGTGLYNRIVYWLADSLVSEGVEVSTWPEYSGSTVGRGFRDGLLRLANGSTDLAVANSVGLARMATRGVGMFKAPVSFRAIAVLPEHDWAVFGVDASLGIRTFADLRDKKVPLRLATGYLNGDNLVGFLAMELLRRHGIKADAESGWEFMTGNPMGDYGSGKANAWFNEAAFPRFLKEPLVKRPAALLSVEPEVARQIEEELGVPSQHIAPNTYPGQAEPLIALDFSGFILAVRPDMDEKLAYELARMVVEKRQVLDDATAYSGIRVASEPGGVAARPFAIEPKTAAKTPVPLHPGAERYYREHGYLD